MDVATMNVSREDALVALAAYKQHRAQYDACDWEIERIYRSIARGRKVISLATALQQTGLDINGRPKLAIARADAISVRCVSHNNYFDFSSSRNRWCIRVDVQGARIATRTAESKVPRIPPQYRPASSTLDRYHVLWEAAWTPVPDRDPYLLRRLSKDAWMVLAAWELTDVELSVMTAHQ